MNLSVFVWYAFSVEIFFLHLYQNNIQKMSIYVGLSLTYMRSSNVVSVNNIFYSALCMQFKHSLHLHLHLHLHLPWKNLKI